MNQLSDYNIKNNNLLKIIVAFAVFVVLIIVLSAIFYNKTEEETSTGGIPLETNFFSKTLNEDLLNQFLPEKNQQAVRISRHNPEPTI